MSYRKIVINEQTYRYKVGRSFVEVRDPTNRSIRARCSDVRGVTTTAFDEGRRSGSSDGMITPGLIKAWIEKSAA